MSVPEQGMGGLGQVPEQGAGGGRGPQGLNQNAGGRKEVGQGWAVLLLGGDFGDFKVMLTPAGSSKNSQKSRDVSVSASGISGIFWGPPTHLHNIVNK